MNFSRGRLLLLLVGLAVTLAVQAYPIAADSASPYQGRVLYPNGPTGALTFSRPTGKSEFNATLPNKLDLPPILGPSQISGASIVGQISLSLWLSTNRSATVSTQLSLSFIQGQNSAQLGSTTLFLTDTSQEFTLNYTIPAPGPPLYAGYLASLNLTVQNTAPASTSVYLHWGSLGAPSRIAIPFKNYASISNLQIRDYRGLEGQTFNAQAGPNQNVVFFTAEVRDIFGADTVARGGDIKLVNLTISGPNGPLATERNVTMLPFCSGTTCPQPATYQIFWVYPPGIAQGTYSVSLTLVDSSGNLIQDTSTAAHSFGIGIVLIPGLPLTLALEYGGTITIAGLATSLVYLTRRRGREYLAPFSYFEQMTGGEIPGGSMVTVEGNTGAGKTTLCSEIMFEDLRRGRPCLYVAADDFPDRVREQMRSLGIDVADYEKSGLLTFIDCYSAEAGRLSTEKLFVPSVGDLTTLGVKISSALQDQRGTCLYLDSLSPFVPRSKPETVVSFVHAFGAKIRGIDGKAVFTLSTGSDATIQRQLEDMADCVIQMEAFEEKDIRRRRLRIRKFRNRPHQESWATFTIESGKGVIFYTRKSARNN